MNKDFKYILQPYRGISTRHTCPSCGHKNEFALYVDTGINQPLHPSVGKCNRDSKCGYHYSPSDYFKDNPDSRPANDWKPVYYPQPVRIEPIVYLPKKLLITNTKLEENNLYRFFAAKFGEVKAKEVFNRYHVGTSKHWRNDNGFSASFPQVDTNGNLRQIKVIAYNPTTGKRLHKEHPADKYTSNGYVLDTNMDKVWFAGKSLLGNYDANLQQCFFGEHLLLSSSKVAIVESEKTAMIASLYLPGFTWLATGGKNGCKWSNKDVSSVLLGKSIILYPDLRCLQEWTEKAEELKRQGLNITVSRFLEDNAIEDDKAKGLDIADYLLKESLPQQQSSTTSTLNDGSVLRTIGELIEFAHSIGVSHQIHVNV